MPQPRVRRQPRLGNRRHVQIYLDERLHSLVAAMARRHNVSFSRAARQLLELGAEQLSSEPQ